MFYTSCVLSSYFTTGLAGDPRYRLCRKGSVGPVETCIKEIMSGLLELMRIGNCHLEMETERGGNGKDS